MTEFSYKSRVLIALVLVLIFSACTTTVTMSDDMSPAELIQRAQEASDKNRYYTAMQYYDVLHDLGRQTQNIDLIITAEYEIAFIHYKQKNYQVAREELNAVLEYYNTPDEELLPQQFKRLSQIVLESIDEKENQNSWFSSILSSFTSLFSK